MKRNMALKATVGLLALGATSTLSSLPAFAEETTEVAAAEQAMVAKLDTSSLATFKASIRAMKASLSSEDKEQLTLAFEKLAASATEPAAGGEPGTEAKTPDVRSTIEIVYTTMGDKLSGKTFAEIVALAG
ncbi:hypothetical protein [Kordiimonas lacus]|uniref:Uncharacterized protein n=1 Tax=Kordiimonas lacus TaxID=637679 RepID=A0A1G7CD67_9PROT|nr:hypothetical protein [Kordiimonas lacus]SDE36680.1 hypothetical protein SAMN04488071_2735 [Kordiimonas lacus]